jgi:hypothetical protein
MLLAISDAAALAILGALLLLFAFSRQRRQRATLSQPETTSRQDAPGSSAVDSRLDAPPSFARFDVAMHETARDLMGRLDTKIVIIEQLVREANQAADRIEALLTRIDAANGRHVGAEPAAPVQDDRHPGDA